MTMKVALAERVELNRKLLKCMGGRFHGQFNERIVNRIKYINWVLILDVLTRI